MTRTAYKFRCDFSVGDAIGVSILWVLITIVTLGLALFVLPYYLPKLVINKTMVLAGDGSELGKLRCDLTLSSMVGNAFLWLILTIITLGLAYVVYVFRVQRVVLNETKIIYNSEDRN
jgi:uncharacterized membrane protein YjgN (DUF898 family)